MKTFRPTGVTPLLPPLSNSAYLSSRKVGAFSLVEVTMALGILSFALIAIVGLLLAGLSSMHGNMEHTVRTQILDWARTQAEMANETQSFASLVNGNPYGFDAGGLPLASPTAPESLYATTLTPTEKILPGSQQSLLGVVVTIKAQARNNELISTHAFWFSK